MSRRACLLLAVLVTPFASLLTCQAGDWPQFLGPQRNSASPERVAAWKESPKVLWRQPVGEAHSSPVVANGTVYAFYKPRGREADALAAFDAKTGERKWEKSFDREPFASPFGAGPQATPAVDGDRVYTYGSTGVLACWEARSGEIAWKVDTRKEYQPPRLFFGVATSPTLTANAVVVMVGGAGHGIVAFDKATGKESWKATDDPASYASPLPLGRGDKEQLVFLTGSHLRALTAVGQELWAVPFKDRLNESSTTPVQAGDLIVASSVSAGSIAVRPGEEADRVWREPKLTCYFSTPVVVGPHLYMINGAATLLNPSITLRCVESATGKVLWTREKVGRYHAALIRTGDDKLLMLDDNGNLMLLEPDSSEYKELSRSKVCGATWAHPALADGKLYIRDEKDLICLEMTP